MTDRGAVVLVTGDRNWGKDSSTEVEFLAMVLDEINRSPGISLLVHGGAPGADFYAGGWAWLNQVPVEDVPAKWDQHGKSAGHIRNRLMYDTFKPDVVVAFHRDFLKSKGTLDMVTYALSKKECMVVIHPSPIRG